MQLPRNGCHSDESRGGKGGTVMAQAAAMEGGFEYQDVMVLDRPAVGTCLRRARRD
jgi:hypothetical protein